jgi:uncharacterized protein (DUF362 family)
MRVAAWRSRGAVYPETPPFHPSEKYPESIFPETTDSQNRVYDGVRQLLRLLELDQGNFDSPDWNPLGEIISPGDTVMLKPNLIKESHPRNPNGWVYLMTHGSVIRAVGDYTAKALSGRGKIIVADGPQTDSSFDRISALLHLREIRDFYRSHGIDFSLIDLRKYEWKSIDDVVVSRRELAGDVNGYVTFDLGDRSLFYGHRGEGKYYGADYDTMEINSHHSGMRHEYVVSGSAIKCDVFINLPKLKTHKKTGVTLSLKNLVGINGDKNYLPHYTEGTPRSGGDQFPEETAGRGIEGAGLRVARRLALSVPVVGPWAYRVAKKAGQVVFGKTSQVVRSGNWHGNDTTWRMCLDLNRVLMYGNPDGTFRDDTPRKYFSIIDGIIGGDGDGPIDVDPVSSGVLIGGFDPVATDALAATLMGIDPDRLALIRNAFSLRDLKLTDDSIDTIDVASNVSEWTGPLSEIDILSTMRFKPHFGWRGSIEVGSE